ncbi:hypothetical protein MUK60_07480 [Streptomyces sp. LRE541]|uniref:hypothetical protein n=1 Tax=Streptomyces sp. LRE541 TaxID=2931983 RepID=UPI002010A368|nr:hypothetical protein [Streptomyces sp. LRE541]UPZ27674.1 hypothetical protein MUK60_07480 [Streptomyces sp. LRE541]
MPSLVFLAQVAVVLFAAALIVFRVGAWIVRAVTRGRIETCDDPTCPECGPAVPIKES